MACSAIASSRCSRRRPLPVHDRAVLLLLVGGFGIVGGAGFLPGPSLFWSSGWHVATRVFCQENGFGCAGQTRISNPDFLVVLLVVGPVRGSGVLLWWGPLLPFSRRRFWLGLSPAPASLLQAFHWILSSFIFVHAITSQVFRCRVLRYQPPLIPVSDPLFTYADVMIVSISDSITKSCVNCSASPGFDVQVYSD